MSMPRFFRLLSGHKMPSIGMGTFEIQGDKMKEVLDFALSMGYTHIDTASSYNNERDIGQVLYDRIRAGKTRRKDVFITSKVPRNCLDNKESMLCSTYQTLEDLKVLSLDMLLIHAPWPFVVVPDEEGNSQEKYMQIDTMNCWRAMESLHNDGLASNIGVSNFTADQLKCVLDIQNVPVSNVQLESHVFYQQRKLKQLCDNNQIVVSAYAPLGAPARPTRHVSGDHSVLQDPVIMKIAEKNKKTPAQVLLNFLLKNGMVVLPKSSNPERLRENLASLDWSLSQDDFKTIQGLDKGQRFFEFLYFRGHPDFHEGEEF